MEVFRKQVEEAATFVRSRVGRQPEIGLILGTGLGGVAEALEAVAIIPYRGHPPFPGIDRAQPRESVALRQVE